MMWGAGSDPLTPCPPRFHMDPSGTFVQCDARAIGSASEGAQSSLQEVYHKVRAAPGAGAHISCLWGAPPLARISSFPPQGGFGAGGV